MVEGDVVDPAVGLSDLVRLGQWVAQGETLARVHAARETAALEAEATLLQALTLTADAPEVPALIYERIS
jgi:thymidine phosphorylase